MRERFPPQRDSKYIFYAPHVTFDASAQEFSRMKFNKNKTSTYHVKAVCSVLDERCRYTTLEVNNLHSSEIGKWCS